MGKIKAALYRFMYGRYGTDKLGLCMLISYVVLMLLHSVLTIFIDSIAFDLIVFIVSTALFATVIFRMFSRNIQKRRRENEKFCGFFRMKRNKFRDRKTHVYRKCKNCGATLRLPKAKGKHFVVCPRCKNRFSVRG